MAIAAGAMVLATGGRSLPKTGSDGAGYELARRLGHTIVPTTPGLAPLVLAGGAGRDARPALRRGARRGADLRVDGGAPPAHRAAAVDALRCQRPGRAGRVAALGARGSRAAADHGELLSRDCGSSRSTRGDGTRPASGQRGASAISPDRCRRQSPRRWRTSCGPREAALASCRARIGGGSATRWPPGHSVGDTRGYSYAEVTAGGVALAEINPATMESRVCPGLYLVGEILDVDGRLGGFNFQWAWASARAPARGWICGLVRV